METITGKPTEDSTLYLDIDGVIFPLSGRKEGVEHGANDIVWVEKHEFYRPSIVKRLGELSTRIVLSSSRGVATLVDPAYKNLLDELNVAGVLSVHAWEPANPDHKLDAIIRHQNGTHNAFKRRKFDASPIGSKLIWVDDDANKINIDTPLDRLSSKSFLTVVPDAYSGLTHQHVDTIESFIKGN